MSPTRIITGTILAADLAAYPGVAVSFYLAEPFIEGGVTYPRSETEVTPNQTTGYFSTSLIVPTTPATATYRIRLVDDTEQWINITEGAAVDIATLLTLAASPIAQSALQTVIDTHVSSYEHSDYNVKSYGATGLGVADDTDALNAAWAAMTDYDTLYLPSGTYLISDTLTWRGLISPKVVGGSVLIKTKAGSDFTNKAMVDFCGNYYSSIDNVMI